MIPKTWKRSLVTLLVISILSLNVAPASANMVFLGSCPRYCQQPNDQLCWACCAAMVISYYLSDNINRTVNIAIDKWGSSDYNQPATTSDSRNAVDDYTNIYGSVSYSALSYNSLKSELNDYDPVYAVIKFKSTGSQHAELIRGYDDGVLPDEVYRVDPWDGDEYISTYSWLNNNSSFYWNQSLTF